MNRCGGGWIGPRENHIELCTEEAIATIELSSARSDDIRLIHPSEGAEYF
jgi:hypothetical protein